MRWTRALPSMSIAFALWEQQVAVYHYNYTLQVGLFVYENMIVLPANI